MPSGGTQLAAAAYLGLVTTALTNFLQTLGQRKVAAEQAAIIYAMDPVYAAGFAYVILGEQLGPQVGCIWFYMHVYLCACIHVCLHTYIHGLAYAFLGEQLGPQVGCILLYIYIDI